MQSLSPVSWGHQGHGAHHSRPLGEEAVLGAFAPAPTLGSDSQEAMGKRQDSHQQCCLCWDVAVGLSQTPNAPVLGAVEPHRVEIPVISLHSGLADTQMHEKMGNTSIMMGPKIILRAAGLSY